MTQGISAVQGLVYVTGSSMVNSYMTVSAADWKYRRPRTCPPKTPLVDRAVLGSVKAVFSSDFRALGNQLLGGLGQRRNSAVWRINDQRASARRYCFRSMIVPKLVVGTGLAFSRRSISVTFSGESFPSRNFFFSQKFFPGKFGRTF